MCTDCGCPPPQHQHGSGHSHGPGEAYHPDHHHPDHDSEQASAAASRSVRIEENLLAKNDRLAAANRGLFGRHGLLVLNLVSSPGSGKTSILERSLGDLRGELGFAVLEGDQQTAYDAERIAATGVPVRQINTGAGCHLDAHMVGHGVEAFDLAAADILMIENVGNLVCPAAFDLGEDHKVAVLSVTEGEDKPAKYPHMFHAADILLINKIDLLPYLRFDLDKCKAFARQVNPAIRIFELSCHSGEGMEAWYGWLRAGVQAKRQG